MKFLFFNTSKEYKVRLFSLVELMVSMAVFSILVLLTVQIASSAKSLWIGSEKRFTLYGDARTAMDLIENLLSSSCGAFQIVEASSDPAHTTDNGLLFVTNSARKLVPDNISQTYAVAFYLDKKNQDEDSGYAEYSLMMRVIGDKNPTYDIFTTSFLTNYGNKERKALFWENDPWRSDTAADNYPKEKDDEPTTTTLLTGVNSFKVYFGKFDDGELKFYQKTPKDLEESMYVPVALKIEIEMFSDADCQIYQDLLKNSENDRNNDSKKENAEKFKFEHAMNFSRVIFMGDTIIMNEDQYDESGI